MILLLLLLGLLAVFLFELITGGLAGIIIAVICAVWLIRRIVRGKQP